MYLSPSLYIYIYTHTIFLFQVAKLDEMQSKGQLGCFGLTEKFAGVQSGLVVNTTAEWNKAKQRFILNTPNEGAKKNWYV